VALTRPNRAQAEKKIKEKGHTGIREKGVLLSRKTEANVIGKVQRLKKSAIYRWALANRVKKKNAKGKGNEPEKNQTQRAARLQNNKKKGVVGSCVYSRATA